MSELDSDEHLKIFPDFVWEEILTNFHKKVVDFQIVILVAVLLIFIRILLVRYILYPLAGYCCVKSSEISTDVDMSVLEELRSLNGEAATKVSELAKKMDWSEKQILRRLKKYSRQGKQLTVERFARSGWAFIFYLTMHLYGAYVLSDNPYFWWLWKSLDYFQDYPYQNVPNGIRWFYIIEMAYYSSEMFLLIVKRKNNVMLFLHHILALLLYSLTWISLLFRAGFVAAFFHDIADIFLEGFRMAKYTRKRKLGNTMFVCFIISWFCFRIVIFPLRAFYPILKELSVIEPQFASYFGYRVIIVLGYILFILNLIWTFMIIKLIKRSLSAGVFEAFDSHKLQEKQALIAALTTMSEEQKLRHFKHL